MSERLHTLKCWDTFFDAIASGDKTFEIRFNDRGFQAGDSLLLIRTRRPLGTYTGERLTASVSYVLNDMGLRDGFVALGLHDVRRLTSE